jgi:hypothetical protein
MVIKAHVAAVLGGLAVAMIGAPTVRADPFTPAEIQYLNDVHRFLPGYGDPKAAAMTDTELVGEGWWACHNHAIGVNLDQAGTNPVIGTWALYDLCPNGCAQGCGHR